MKAILATSILLLASFTAQAQVSTTAHLKWMTANCIWVDSQDGDTEVFGAGGSVCQQGFFGGGALQINLVNDPANPGSSLTLYQCAQVLLSDTSPGVSTTRQPNGSKVWSLDCSNNEPYGAAEWTGTLTYNYTQVYGRRCSSGHPVCYTKWWPSWVDGSLTLSTPTPPPPAPPPPAPVVYNLTLLPATVDSTGSLASLTPTDTSYVTAIGLDMTSDILTVVYTDGSAPDFLTIGSIQLGSVNSTDDYLTYVYLIDAPSYDANGNLVKDVSLALTLSVVSDTGVASISGGTATITVYPQP